MCFSLFILFFRFAHGSMEEGKKIELDCVERGVHLFIEKPVSCASPSDSLLTLSFYLVCHPYPLLFCSMNQPLGRFQI